MFDSHRKALSILHALHYQYPKNPDIVLTYLDVAAKVGDYTTAKQMMQSYVYTDISKVSDINRCPITLHIGVHKTGTTFVQDTLQLNSKILKDNHISHIPLDDIREHLNMSGHQVNEYLSGLTGLFSQSIHHDTKNLIFSEENIISSAGMLTEHVYAHARNKLSLLKFYLTEVYQCPVRKVVLTLRSYDSFFQSFFLEMNRHSYVDIADVDQHLLLNYSWRRLVDDTASVFGKDNIQVLFFEDVINNQSLIFDHLTADSSIYPQLTLSKKQRKSPNYKAYQQLQLLHDSKIDRYSQAFITKCLMYPYLLKEAFETVGAYDSDIRRLAENVIFDIHTEKLSSNLLFTEKEVNDLRKKYQEDKQFIKDNYPVVIE